MRKCRTDFRPAFSGLTVGFVFLDHKYIQVTSGGRREGLLNGDAVWLLVASIHRRSLAYEAPAGGIPTCTERIDTRQDILRSDPMRTMTLDHIRISFLRGSLRNVPAILCMQVT